MCVGLRPSPRPRSFPVVAVLVFSVGLLAALPAAAQTGSPCTPSDTELCLLNDRFEVTVEWTDSEDNPFHLPGTPLAGQGMATLLTPAAGKSDTGYFWFSDPDDVELMVKVVDGRGVNGHFWFFYGATTNVEYTIRVLDTETDRTREYFNPLENFGVGADTAAFEELADELRTDRTSTNDGVEKAVFLPRKSLPSCDDPAVTCLHDGRFAVESVFTQPGREGSPFEGRSALTTPTSAILYPTSDDNPETVVKVLDARQINGRFWIFATTFSLPVDLTVTDLETGIARTFESGVGGFALGDRNGFIVEPPAGEWMETAELPGFRFKVRITGAEGEVATRQEADCVPETLCVSGALAGRSELFLRIVGPKPNGYLQPNVVKFSTSQIEVWIEQLASGQINYYELEGASPGSDTLDGLFDRTGFQP